jgi:hypothetical protein
MYKSSAVLCFLPFCAFCRFVPSAVLSFAVLSLCHFVPSAVLCFCRFELLPFRDLLFCASAVS